MIFEALPLAGAVLACSERKTDERGWFARLFCSEEFALNKVDFHLVQASVAHNPRKGTLRGLHYQDSPHAEAKLVQCLTGAVYDVLVDVRPESDTYRRWCSVELSEERSETLFVPAGVAHGYQTLTDATMLLYMMSQPYVPDCARGVRWDDPSFAIDWPPEDRIISGRDLGWEDYDAGAGSTTPTTSFVQGQ